MVDALKKWMRKEDIYDNDLYAILVDQGVEDPEEDFKTYTQANFDELFRKGCVERAKELKDQKAKLRLEKKVTKIEKYWRKSSGVKSTSIKKSKKKDKEAPADQSSKAANNDAMSAGADLKKFFKKQGCFDKDLLLVCVQMGICSEEDIEKIESNSSFDEIYRQVRVLRVQELKDNAARIRMEKTMTKFEKIWRGKTGVKKSSIQKKTNKTKKKSPKEAANEEMASSGAELKKWMRKNNVWEMALYDELVSNDICGPDDLVNIDEKTFDKIVRKVRVDRFSQLKDQASRNRADKLLVSFEKLWRKATGIKKTSIK